MSVPQMPTRCTRTRTSPRTGFAAGGISIVVNWPGRSRRIACMARSSPPLRKGGQGWVAREWVESEKCVRWIGQMRGVETRGKRESHSDPPPQPPLLRGGEMPGSPTERHVRFDGALGFVQVDAGVEHVEADGMDFVAGGAGEAIAGGVAGV